MTKLLPVLVLAAAMAACNDAPPPTPDTSGTMAVSLPTGTPVDLTYAYDERTVFWPTAEGFVRETTAEGMTEAGYYYAAGNLRLSEHGGTHLDAPIHFAEGGQTADEIPLERLMGPGIVIDVTQQATQSADYRITVEDLTAWETAHQPIADGTIIFFRTGFGSFWPDRQRYMGTDARGEEAVADLHFPGLHADAARWLVENRKVNAIGIDTPSIDYGQSQLFETHRLLFAQNIPAFENVANLDQLPDTGFGVIALPMKIRGGSGGPVRIVAFVP